MTIPATGSFTSETVRAEYGLGLPMSSEQLRVAAGLGLPYSSENLRGLSSFSVDFTEGGATDVTAGSPVSGNRRQYTLLTAVVSGGSGSYTYSWTNAAGTYFGGWWLNQQTNATAQWSESYNVNDFPGTPQGDNVSVTLTVTDPSTGKTGSKTKTVTNY